MLDLRTLWLTLPEDRYEANPGWRNAERLLHPLLLTLRGWDDARAGGAARAGAPRSQG
jgi:hypothetical protein